MTYRVVRHEMWDGKGATEHRWYLGARGYDRCLLAYVVPYGAYLQSDDPLFYAALRDKEVRHILRKRRWKKP